MKTFNPNHNNYSNTNANNSLPHFASKFILDFPCIITNDLVQVQKDYLLVDFLENGSLNVKTVKFMHAFLRGNVLVINIISIEQKKLLQRFYIIDNDICDWVLMDKDVFEPETDKK